MRYERRYGLRHRTSKRYLSEHPHVAHGESPDKEQAVSWSTKQEAEMWRLELAPFAEAWAVVPVRRLRDQEVAS